MLSALDDSLIGNEHATVELRGEIADILFSALHILVNKYVLEFVQEGLLEKLSNQFES